MAVEFGKYQLLRRIGAGGMGQVFLARTVGTQDFEKLLVIKRLLPHLSEDEDFLSMFLDEARIAARLNHPNLIQIFELGEFADSHYLVMEYVAGENLRKLERFSRAQSRPLPLGVRLRIIADAAAGLDYAHRARDAQGHPLGLVHRDVSPQNILVGFDGAVKLIDFGVAKAAGKLQHTASGVLKGKYPYMSPEQALGEELDARSDIFALGIVLWELLTGKRLFKAESDLTTMRLVSACQVPPPSKLGGPAELDALVLKALAREPAGRYPEAAAFRMAIEDYILEHRLQASSAHLEGFMRELYKERIAYEADPASLDQLHGPLDVDPGSAPSASFSMGVAGTPPDEPAARGGDRTPSSKSSRSSGRSPGALRGPRDGPRRVTVAAEPPGAQEGVWRWVALAGLGLAVGVGLGAAALVFNSSRKPVEPAPNGVLSTPAVPHELASTGPRPAASPGPDVPAPLETRAPEPVLRVVQLRLVSEPPGATVRVGGKALGATPVDYALPLDAAPVAASFSLSGFEPYEVSLSPGNAPVFSAQLKKKSSKPERKAVNLGIKTDR